MISIPYYELTILLPGRRSKETIYLEAYLSEIVKGRDICLLASRRPNNLEETPKGSKLTPWSTPVEVLERFISEAEKLMATPLPPSPAKKGWVVRRVIQELNRLIVGGLAGPPLGPEVSRDRVTMYLAKRLCSDILGDLIRHHRSLSLVAHRVLWKNVEAEYSNDEVRIYLASGELEKILTYLSNNDPRVKESLLSILK